MTGIYEIAPTPVHDEAPSLDRLGLRPRAFVLHYVLGEEDVRGKVVASYKRAGYNPGSNNSASVGAYTLLKDPRVKEAIRELRKSMEQEALGRMRPWAIIAEKCQRVLEAAVDTMVERTLPEAKRSGRPAVVLDPTDLAVLREGLDRALGRATQPVEIGLNEGLDALIKRLATPPNQARPEPEPELGEHVGELHALPSPE